MTTSDWLTAWLGGAGLVALLAGILGNSQTEQLPARSATTLVVPAPPEATVAARRIAAKDRVIAQLLAGELTLLEAAGSFRLLHAGQPDPRPDSSHPEAGAAEVERFCRQVIHWARQGRTRSGPGGSDPQIERLDRELEALLARGPLELPW